MNNEPFNYLLVVPIEYAHKGNKETGTFITCSPPTAKIMTECARLKQAFFRALPKDADVTEEIKQQAKEMRDETVSGPEIMAMLSVSNDVDLDKVFVSAKILLTSGVCMVEGQEKLTGPLWDSLSYEDMEALTGDYIANFIVASSLSKMKNL